VRVWAPITAAVLLDTGVVAHIWRMLQQQSAAGQSVLGWLVVILGLLCWAQFYFVVTPDEIWAKVSILVGVVLNIIALCTVIFVRHM
jgi:hypothetical protein